MCTERKLPFLLGIRRDDSKTLIVRRSCSRISGVATIVGLLSCLDSTQSLSSVLIPLNPEDDYGLLLSNIRRC